MHVNLGILTRAHPDIQIARITGRIFARYLVSGGNQVGGQPLNTHHLQYDGELVLADAIRLWNPAVRKISLAIDVRVRNGRSRAGFPGRNRMQKAGFQCTSRRILGQPEQGHDVLAIAFLAGIDAANGTGLVHAIHEVLQVIMGMVLQGIAAEVKVLGAAFLAASHMLLQRIHFEGQVRNGFRNAGTGKELVLVPGRGIALIEVIVDRSASFNFVIIVIAQIQDEFETELCNTTLVGGRIVRNNGIVDVGNRKQDRLGIAIDFKLDFLEVAFISGTVGRIPVHRHLNRIDTDTVKLEAVILGLVDSTGFGVLVIDTITGFVIQCRITPVGGNRTKVNTELDASRQWLPCRRIVTVLCFGDLIAIIVHHIVMTNREILGGPAHVMAGRHGRNPVTLGAYGAMELVEVRNRGEQLLVADSRIGLGGTGILPPVLVTVPGADIVTPVGGHPLIAI